MRRVFELDGWTCSEAENGEEAIARAQQFNPDIIVLDFLMPVMNGLAAAKTLSQVLPRTPLILFTALGDVLKAEDIRRAGFWRVIDKSESGELMTAAESLLRLGREAA